MVDSKRTSTGRGTACRRVASAAAWQRPEGGAPVPLKPVESLPALAARRNYVLHNRSRWSEREEARIGSDFQPSDPDWRFRRWFSRARVANSAADRIFPGANDLVVDTESMLGLPSATARHDFGRNETVHHTNYFAQNAALSFIRKRLELD